MLPRTRTTIGFHNFGWFRGIATQRWHGQSYAPRGREATPFDHALRITGGDVLEFQIQGRNFHVIISPPRATRIVLVRYPLFLAPLRSSG